ncbi:MAG: hypothetical protein AAGA23_03275 [Pseudomonadota bacterium]
MLRSNRWRSVSWAGGLGLCLAALLSGPAAASETKRIFSNCVVQPITDFWEGAFTGGPLGGGAGLCATRRGLQANMQVTGMKEGNAYTVWWVYVDNPGACVNFPLTTENSEVPVDEPLGYATPCGLADFFTPDESGEFLNPLVVFGRMDGAVAKQRNRHWLSGDFKDFVPASGSQVWLFVFGHGPADLEDKRQLARQLLTPEDPLSGIPHLGIEGRPFGYPAGVAVFDVP